MRMRPRRWMGARPRPDWMAMVVLAMTTSTALDLDAVSGGPAASGGAASRPDQEGRSAETVILAVIFAGATAEVIALCALLW
jgi:hypothetical protein